MVKENGMIMLSEKEFERKEREIQSLKEEYERRIELLQNAVLALSTKDTPPHGVRVGKADFIEIYNTALNEMFDHPERGTNDIYNHDFFVYWHGIYCNCGDGAAPSNYLIPAIEGMNEEDPTEY